MRCFRARAANVTADAIERVFHINIPPLGGIVNRMGRTHFHMCVGITEPLVCQGRAAAGMRSIRTLENAAPIA